MDYSNLSDNVSGYLTANEEECDNSQYLSILSQDITLEDMNGTLTNVKNEESNEAQLVPLEDTNEPLIFNVDGTNGIYSVVAQDEDGNLQKYQIQYSEDINGEVMPVLETIQFLPLEYEEEVISEENCSPIQICESNDEFVIANEQYISEKNDYNVDNMEQEQINTNNEWNISALQCASYNVPMKMEPENYYDQTPILETEIVKVENPIEVASIDTDSEEVRMDDGNKHLVAVQHLEINHCINDEQLYEETIEHDTLEHVSPNENQLQNSENNKNPELYQVANTVTLNLDNNFDQNVNCILKESIDQPKSNILKKSSQRSLLKDFVGEEQRILYLQAPPEKENIKILDIDRFIKPSSRSLLKCNQPTLVKETDSAKITNASRNVGIKSNSRNNEIKQSQTYNRTRESKQARQFMNFINSTTIPQVPERKERLPRKQQITPLKHQNEDIVVKEMIVSSKGFVEPVSAEERKHLPVTEYVELIDSGDESSPECNSKKKRKNSLKDKLIEISDTDESDTMELEPEKARCAVGNKRDMKKRGRPPKMINNDKKQTYPNSPPKISRLDSEVERVTSTLQVIRMENEITNEEIPVENITKAKNGGDMHKSQECSAKNNSNQPIVKMESSETNKSKESLIFKNGFEYKHECEKCKSKFINKFLLNRHDCIVRRGPTLSCDICKLKFTTNTSLNQHKKSHINPPTMVKSNVTKIPKHKSLPEKETPYNSTRSSTARPPSVVVSKPPVKIPSRHSILPTKSTKTLSIKNARHSELPTRVRKSSVPLKSVGVISKHLEVPIENHSSGNTGKKCIEVNNSKPLTRGNNSNTPSIEVTPKKTSKKYIFKCEIQCDKCSEQFHNNTTWFEHQVSHHGFKTPDKTVGAKKQKKIVKEKITHSGLSVAPIVAKNFAILRSKLQQI